MPNTTWNNSDKGGSLTLSGGDLVVTNGGLGQNWIRAADKKVTGKFYWETTLSVNSANPYAGITNGTTSGFTSNVASTVGYAFITPAGSIHCDGVSVATGLGSIAIGSIICIAVDIGAQLVWIKNGTGGTWNGSLAGNPVTSSGGVRVPFGGGVVSLYPMVGWYNGTSGSVWTTNFGDTAFAGTVPSGFTAGFPTGSPAPFMSFTGVAREALVVDTAANQRVSFTGIVRETLIGGYRIESQIYTKTEMRGQLTITGGTTAIAGGAGGGGAAGLFGAGEYGQSGVYDGTGGYGGAADNYLTARQLTPSSVGNVGHEWDGTYGSGSGGSGGSWGGSGRGGNGGRGGLYGGGGGGGGGGHSGGGLGALGGEGVIYLEYDPGTGPIVILITKDSPPLFTFPLDWNTSNNTVLIVGAGGCGANGGLTTGGGGGGGGDVVGAVNTGLYSPGQVISIDVPSAAEVCAGTAGNTHLGSNSAQPGANGNGSTSGTPSVPYTPSEGGIGHGGGGTGVVGGGTGGPATGGAGGGVAVLVASRIEGKSLLTSDVLTKLSAMRQHAVSVQTWHW